MTTKTELVKDAQAQFLKLLDLMEGCHESIYN